MFATASRFFTSALPLSDCSDDIMTIASFDLNVISFTYQLVNVNEDSDGITLYMTIVQ